MNGAFDLDVASRRALWDEIERFKQGGGTVLLTAHYLEEAKALADRIAVIHRGRLLAEGSPAEIKRRVGLRRLRFRASALPELPGVARAERDGDLHTLWSNDADVVVRRLVESGVAFHELEVPPVSLEEAFLAVLNEEAP
ncbi:hypothetical protein [Oceanithermus sp.]